MRSAAMTMRVGDHNSLGAPWTDLRAVHTRGATRTRSGSQPVARGAEFGFSNTVASEPWHWEYWEGDHG